MAATQKRVSIIFGCNNMGGSMGLTETQDTISYLATQDVYTLDAAFMYSNGLCEEYIGMHPDSNKFSITTKANPWNGMKLTPESIRYQLTTSLSRLKRPYVDMFYLHIPDHDTPIEDTLSEVNKLYREGLIKEFGLSNYKSWEVVDICHICKGNNWLMPSAYQGMYNGIVRAVESELFPALRKFGLRFQAYNPLAGSLLTGKHCYSDRRDENILKGRFEGNVYSHLYKDRYWHESYFTAISHIQKSIETAYNGEVTLTEASLRWMMHHSILSGYHSDSVVLGASSLVQCKENIQAVYKGPLKDSVVQAYEHAWQVNKGICPSYHR